VPVAMINRKSKQAATRQSQIQGCEFQQKSTEKTRYPKGHCHSRRREGSGGKLDECDPQDDVVTIDGRHRDQLIRSNSLALN